MVGTANDLNISEAGYVTFDGTSVFHGRTFQAGTGITLTNASGVAGNTTISTTASLTDLHVARYIVSAAGTSGTGANYSTITAAVAALLSDGGIGTIFIQPGTYTENLTLVGGMSLCAFDCDAFTPTVTLLGKITIAGAGRCAISGINLFTNSDYILEVTGISPTIVVLNNCYLNIVNNTAILFTSSHASSAIYLNYCLGDIVANNISLYSSTSAGSIYAFYCNIEGSGASTVASTMTLGVLFARYSFMSVIFSFTGTSSCQIFKSVINNGATNTACITFNSTVPTGGTIDDCWFSSNTASCITIGAGATLTIRSASIFSSNTNTITGAGTLNYANILFSASSSTINTTTHSPFVTSNDAIKIVTPAAYPYTTTPQDALIKVDTSAARTIIPLSSPTTGQRHIIKDTVGSAAANNITITPSGKNIDGAASSVINVAYGSVTIVYNGTEWSII